MENTKFCQSCSMPLVKDEDYGTNEGGSKNEDYCQFCYQDGKFLASCTMDQMVEISARHMAQQTPEMTLEQAKGQLNEFFPTLKRWKK